MGFSKRYMALALIISNCAVAAPIDWNGSLDFNSEIIRDFRRTGDNCTPSDGSECINPDEDNARFQNMVFKLNPSIIVNDGVTVKGEFSAGTNRTTQLGENTERQTAYFSQSTSSNLNVNQIYAEIYADTALYRVGRFAKHYGLGAVINSGTNPWDNYYSGYEGFEAQLKLGSFNLTPMIAKIHTDADPNGGTDVYETSVMAMYDNAIKNLKVGIYYALRESSSSNSKYGSQEMTLMDVFVEKKWDKFKVGLEIPMITGDASSGYGNGDADFDSNAYILETTYTLNSKWDVGLNAGMVKGDDGSSDSFEAMYLHPNYKIAEVMFKYNYHGFTDSTYDIYNSSIVNATYAKFFANYSSGEWTWKLAAIWAKANEVAQDGKDFYNHDKGKLVTGAAADQSDDLGYELDVAFDYQWNPSVIFSGFLGYHFVGDFYAFSNEASDELSVSNVMSTGMKLSVSF